MFARLVTVAAGLATLAAAASVRRDGSRYVQITVNIASGLEEQIYTTVYANMWLTSLDDVSASGLKLNDWDEYNVNPYTVQCCAYKDTDGVEAASLPFIVGSPAALSKNLVTIGSVLCYVVEEGEVATTSCGLLSESIAGSEQISKDPNHDAVVVGAGFGGLAALYFLKEQGLNVKGIDSASDVGGTWYWNRYPGARSDVESFVYRLSIDKELLRDDPRKNNYLTQPELISYFQASARRNDLYPRIQFNAELKAASWDEKEGLWHLDSTTGEALTTRYLVTAIGILHRPSLPKLPGLNTLGGKVVRSAQWRDELNPYIKKRVAVIGAGASGVQLVGALSETAQHLTHSVRHAQYVLPAQMRPVGPEERSLINAKYDQTWTDVFTSAVAMGFIEPNRPALSVSPEDGERTFQNLWNQGSGFRFMFGGFSDIVSDEAANKEASAFIHQKTREIVKDEQKADVLTSTDWFARRPLTDDRYYQAFNQDDVTAIDLEKTPIEAIVPYS
ncbi:hypothetical protein LTS14_008172 [Recurvomyces mirabilis]|uniref:uncharacterized protein n=1 Tax=Recurvomyces mirabilis TaxID=574656 RepID=UPI002DDFC21A|nr:hypothetical protein LTS14_008172 [Recurvomyces mirabilis]